MDVNQKTYRDSFQTLTSAGQPFELEQQTFDGVEYAVFKNAPRTLQDVYLAAKEHGDREFVKYQGESWSFGALLQQAWSIASALRDKHSIEPGSRVGIAMRNYPEWLSAFIGITSMGAIAVPINSWGKAQDLLFAARDSECKIIFCDQQRFDLMESGLAESNIPAVVARPEASFAGSNAQSLDDFINDHGDAEAPATALDCESMAMIMYTSGTTGKPKGAMSSHRAICQSLLNFECTAMASAMANPELIGRMMSKGFEPVQMLTVPLFHVSGLHAIFLTALRAGRKIVMLYKWDAEDALKVIEEERVTILSAAPSMLLQLLESPEFDRYDTSSLSSLGGGGSATPAKVAQLMSEKIDGLYPGTGWGMTETNSIGTAFTGQAFVDNPRSAGFCQATADIKICDENGDEVTPGTPGRIWIKSVTNAKGYWNRAEANAESFKQGWFDTEDIGYFDEHGYLYLSDRAKDLIIRGGENIYPAEIEAVLAEHPRVLEVAAFGVSDQTLGEQVGVAVVPRAGETISAEAIQHFAREHLAAFKVPHRVDVRSEPLPRNAAGKVLKKVLQTTAA